MNRAPMNNMPEIREASPADYDLLATIIRGAFRDVAQRFSLTKDNCPKHPSNCTSDWIESDILRGVRYFILYVDRKPAGCVGIESPRADICYLERLSVLPEMRGRHLGVRLVEHVLECAASKGAGKVGIGIIAEQTELKEWYKRLGFVEARIKSFPHLPFKVCLMEYKLRPLQYGGGIEGGFMFAKVCGLKTKQQIDKAIEYGYDAIGVVTYIKSKRYCLPEIAVQLAEYAKGRIKSFVVGLTYDDVRNVAHAFDHIQIYEKRQVPNLALASKEMPPSDLKYDYFVYDASIGSGIFKEFPEWIKNRTDKLVVAGGLTKDNVCEVIRAIRPYGVDVSSGVEKDGVKDPAMMKEFIDAVRSCSV